MPDAKPPKNLDRLVRFWKIAYVASKKIEAKVDAAKAKVVELLKQHGIEHIETKLGKIGFQTKTVEDWEGLARSMLAPQVIAGMLPSFTKQSAPFIRAPSSWSSEAAGGH